MAFKERTLEFNKLVEELRQKKLGPQGGGRDFGGSHPTHSIPTGHTPSMMLGKNGMNGSSTMMMNGHREVASSVPKSQFALVASQLGKQIQETAAKLGKLTDNWKLTASTVAKNSRLFDHEKTAGEINHLTLVIKQDIQSLNSQIEALQNHVRSQKYLKKNQQTESHASSIVTSLKSQLANTTKKFQQVLETRTENLKKQQEKRQQFEGMPSRNSASLEIFKPRAGFSAGGQSGEASVAIGLFDSTGGSTSQAGGALVPFGGQQQQQQSSYIASRAVAVENIEQTIIELQGIFTQLATIVAEQGEMMQRIDANIEDARSNVEGAQGELLKYLQGISGNKWLIVKIFLVLIVFIIIFVVFFV